MDVRKAFLRKLSMKNEWEAASRARFAGESWIESRNTLYRFFDGVCIDIAARGARRGSSARTLIGMRLVGWLADDGFHFTNEWQAGACAVLWRPGALGVEEAMGMTSATTAFVRGPSSVHLQALHDRLAPADSQSFRRRDAEAAIVAGARPRLPSSSYRSG
jgi:hypothetical protein